MERRGGMMRHFTSCLAAFAVLTLSTGGPADLRAEGISTEQADAILDELKGIRKLLEAQQALLERSPAQAPAAERVVKLPSVEAYVLGSQDAPVTLVEFTDYQCPFCSRFHTDTYPQLKRDFIDTGKVRFISRDLPLSIHKQAFPAARAARCAGEQKKFWEMRHVLSSNPKNLSESEIGRYAGNLGLDPARFQACLESTKYDTDIRRDEADARSIGISGTPAFILGGSPRGGQFEGVHISGAQPYAIFVAKINKLLNGLRGSDSARPQ
jgi:protein-disulfide isomerase